MTKNCILYDCFNAIDDHYQTLICTLIDSRKSILVNSLSFNLLMRGFFANEAYYRYLFHHSYYLSLCLVLILVDCVLKKSCYRLSINVKKQTILS